MTAQEMWDKYRKINERATDFEAWKFCGGGQIADELAELAASGEKTATASLYLEYGDEPLPKVGEYSVILYDDESACCVIKTTKVTLCPFDEVSKEHAFKEGEGDKSLATWRQIHRRFFAPYFESNRLKFDEKTLIVLEEFEVVYR